MRRTLALLAALLAMPAIVAAQDRPFTFSIATAPATTSHSAVIGLDFGAGEQTFKNNVTNGPEERVALQAYAGRLTFVANVGIASTSGDYDTSQQAEVLYTLTPAGRPAFALAAGGGLLHEADGVNVWLGRAVASWRTNRTLTIGNVIVEHADDPLRDPVDVIATAGWSRKLTPAVSLGVEGIGEDLEGFWDAEEAEGGARILVGPSLHVAPPARRWEFSVAGGPTFHPTTSPRSSGAVRDLPATTSSATSYAIRVGFDCRFGSSGNWR